MKGSGKTRRTMSEAADDVATPLYKADPGYLVGCSSRQYAELMGQNMRLEKALEEAKERLRDILKGDDGQAHKEAEKWLQRNT